MPKLSPQVQQFLSALGVALGIALLAFLQKETALLTPDLQILAVSVLGFIAHRIPALGTEQAVAQNIASGEASSAAIKTATRGAL